MADIGLVYEIFIVGRKFKKVLTLPRQERRKLVIDESRMWNLKNQWQKNNSARDRSRISFSEGYLYFTAELKSAFNITTTDFDFSKLSKIEKIVGLTNYLKNKHNPKINESGFGYFFAFYGFSKAIVIFMVRNRFVVFPDRTHIIFVPQYYHDRRSTSF